MASERPNILMIFADHLRADALGCMGNNVARTPKLDALAARGSLFTNCCVTQPTCTPSRASVLTGRMPSVLRTRMVGCSMPSDEITLPSLLSRNGYRTMSIGKIHLRPQRAETEYVRSLPEGDSYYGFGEVDLVDGHGDACMGNKYTPWLNERFPGWSKKERVACPELRDTYESRVPLEGWSSKYIAESAERFLRSEEAVKKPFFLHVSFPDPHPVRLSFTVPPPYDHMFDNAPIPPPLPPYSKDSGMSEVYEAARYGRLDTPSDYPVGTATADYSKYTPEEWQLLRSRYYGMVALLDESIGKILAALDDSGLTDNTVIVFLSDHGDYLGDHGLHGKGFMLGSALRVPMIWAGPEIRRQRCEKVASTIDIMPTLLRLTGIGEPVGMQGISFAGYLSNGSGYTRCAALSENDDDYAGFRVRTVTTGKYQFNYYAGSSYCELFDMTDDPGQTRNYASVPSMAKVVARMKGLLLEEVVSACDTVNGRTQKPVPEVVKWVAGHNG